MATPSGGRHIYVSFRGGLPGHWRRLAPDFGKGEFRFGPAAYVAAPPSITDRGSYELVAGDLRQLPELEVADVLPILGNQDTGKADDVAAAILATAAAGEPGRIGRGTWALLRGDGCDRYPSRSEAEAAIVAGCVNAGLSFAAILGLFQTRRPRASLQSCTARGHRRLSGISGEPGRTPSSGLRRIHRKGASWHSWPSSGRNNPVAG